MNETILFIYRLFAADPSRALYLITISIFAVFLLAEITYSLGRKKRLYSLPDTFANLGM